MSGALPQGACDSHCHVFGPAARFPYAEPRSYTPDDAPLEAYLALLDRLGFDRGVLVQPSAYGRDNRAMLDALTRAPSRLRGVAVGGAELDAATLKRWHSAGVRGLRANEFRRDGKPYYQNGVTLEEVQPLLPAMAELGWHLQLWIDTRDLPDLLTTLAEITVPVVVDHMGRVPSAAGVDQPPLRALIELSRLEKCWIKVCGSERISMPPYVAAVPIAHALVETAPDRVLWGTDFPHPNATHEADEADLVDLVPQFAPDALAQKSLLVDNPARLYGFGS